MENALPMESLQKRHYDSIAAKYAAHYGDKWSLRYRREFINGPMLKNIRLKDAVVLDAMCGSGESTGYLVDMGARVTAVDISQEEIRHFRQRFPFCETHCTSILSTGLPGDSFDCVVLVGGLHHLHPHIPAAIDEIHRILKPGGRFCFAEPHRGSLPDRLPKTLVQNG